MSKIDNNRLQALELDIPKKHVTQPQPFPTALNVSETAIQTPDSSKISTLAKTGSKPEIAFIGENAASPDDSLNENINTVIQNFDQKVNGYLKAQGNNLPAFTGKDIYAHQAKIKKMIGSGKFTSVNDIKKLNDEFLSMSRLLSSAGVMNNDIKSGMDKMVSSLLQKYGKDFGMQLNPKIVNGVIVSLDAKTENNKPLNNDQKNVLKEAAFLAGETEALKTMKSPLTSNGLAMMGMRQALLNHGMALASLPDQQVAPDLKFKDLEVIATTLKTLDEMMGTTRNISPTLIADMERTVSNMLDAPGGQITSLLNELGTKTDPLKDAGKSLAPVKNSLDNAGGQIKSGTDSTGIKDGTNSLNDGTKFILDIIKNSPYDLSDRVGKMINSYSSVMNQVQKSMPTLPFPVTMPNPMTYNDGNGNSFFIPAGSKVTSNSKGFTIDGNGIMMQSGSTIVNAGKSIIQVGKNDIDKLAFDSLSVNSGGSNSSLKNFEATINRKTGVSVIKADEAVIDMSTGNVKLTNANLTRDQNGALKVDAASFFYQGKNGDSTGFNALHLEQSTANGISNLSGSAKDLKMNNAGEKITADSMSFNMVKDSNTNTESGQILANNVNYLSKDGNLKADSATINYLTSPDGTKLNFNAVNPEWTSAKDHLKVDGNANLFLTKDKNGNLTNMNALADKINYTGNNGSSLDATKTNLNIDYNPNGTVSDISAGADTLNYADKSGNINASGGKINLKYDKDGKIQEINGDVKKLDYLTKDGDKIGVTNGATDIKYGDNGKLASITGSAAKIDYTGKNGDIINATGTNIALNYNKDGKLQDAAASAGNVSYLAKSGDKINVTNGSMKADYNDKGLLKDISGSADKLNLISKNGDTVDASGLNVALNYDDNGVLKNAGASAGTINYTGKSGDIVSVNNGSANFNYNDKGVLTGVNGSIESLNWTGSKGDTLTAKGTNVDLKYGDNDLLQTASASTGSINYASSKGDKVDVLNGSANLIYDANGKLSKATGAAESLAWTGKTGDTATAKGVNLSIDTSDPKNAKLAGSAQNINYTKISDKSSKLTIDATNATVTNDNKQMNAHIDSAKFVETMTKDLKEKYNVTVENVDLVVNKNEKGGLQSAEAKVGAVKAKIDDINLTVKTQNGDRVRLNVSMSKDGTYITEAFLQIPNGGEIKVTGKDYDVTMGGDQKVTFSQDGKGLYTLRDDGTNIKANFKDTKVNVQGGSAQVSLDTKNGNIIINDITGTNINLETKSGQKVNIDIQKIKDLMVQGGTFDDGTTKGFALYLKPNSSGSSMSLVASADVKGIPIKVAIDNVHDFEASGYYTTNLAHVYIGDKSGKGNVELSAGPLKSYGSAVEFVARYNPYDTQRMLTSLNSLLTNDGTYLGKGFSVEADGVIRLGTQFNGPHAEIAVMLPHNYQNPYNMTSPMLKDDAFGIVTSLGWKFENKAGDKLTMDLNAGLLPGSYVSINQLKGSTTLYGIPLAKENALPTTAAAGLTLRFETAETKVNMTSGAYVNPAAFVPEGKGMPLSETTKYGSYTGFSVTRADSTYSAFGTVGFKKDNEMDPGFRLGYARKFGWSEVFGSDKP